MLVQATLLAWIVARAFHGASLRAVAVGIVLLALAFAARGVLAWGFEVAGNRAAGSVLSELRLDLVRAAPSSQPAALDGVEGHVERGEYGRYTSTCFGGPKIEMLSEMQPNQRLQPTAVCLGGIVQVSGRRG